MNIVSSWIERIQHRAAGLTRVALTGLSLAGLIVPVPIAVAAPEADRPPAVTSPAWTPSTTAAPDAIVMVTGPAIEPMVATPVLEAAAKAKRVWLLDGAGRLRAEVAQADPAQRATTLATIARMIASGSLPPVDLPQSLTAVMDLAGLSAANWVEVFVLGGLNDAQNKFANGYPNEGYLFLDDTGFRYLPQPGQSQGQPRDRTIILHVIHPRGLPFAPQWERWADLLVQTRLGGGMLATFNADGRLGERGARRWTAADVDHGVTTSKVLTEPVCMENCGCAADTAPLAWLPSEETTYTVRLRSTPDPCLRNAVVALRLNGRQQSLRADDTGVIATEMRLRQGANLIEQIPTTAEHTDPAVVYRRVIPPRADVIRVEGLDADAAPAGAQTRQVTLFGQNPLREPGSTVAIRHVQSNRAYEARVGDDGGWSARVATSQGANRFEVSQPAPLSAVVVEIPGRDCEDLVTSTVLSGTATLNIVNACRAGATVTFEYDAESWTRTFDQAGKVQLKLPLAMDRVQHDIWFSRADGTKRFVSLTWGEALAFTRVTLRWLAGLDLDLHVIEPGGALGGPGHIYFGRMHGVGNLDIDDQGRNGGQHVENYVVPTDKVAGKQLSVFVDLYERYRNGTATAPYCGPDAAPVRFEVEFASGAARKPETLSFTMPVVACGNKPSSFRERFIPIRTFTVPATIARN